MWVLCFAAAPASSGLDEPGGDGGAEWSQLIIQRLRNIRGLLPTQLMRLRAAEKDESRYLASVLSYLARTDLLLCQARYAMEVFPAMASSQRLRQTCAAVERTLWYMWSRLGLYRNAAAWARRGLAVITARVMSRLRLEAQGYLGAAQVTGNASAGKLQTHKSMLSYVYYTYVCTREKEGPSKRESFYSLRFFF